MNNKALATIVIALFFVSILGMSFSLTPIAKGVNDYKWLTIKYSPDPMTWNGYEVVPDIAPTPGSHNYTLNSMINVTAPLVVNVTDDVRYVFDYWEDYFEEDNITKTFTDNSFSVKMDQNKTCTAYYHIQYLFTVITQFDTAWIYDPVAATWDSPRSSMWFDNGTTGVKAGLSTGRVDVESMHRAFFVNWTGDATGDPESPITGSQHSDPLNMTGPKTAVANWVEKYYLYTGYSYYPHTPTGPYDPDKEGYYPVCTEVELTAPNYTNISPNRYRWRFDHWEIEKWNYTSGAWELAYTETAENITVHIDHPTIATVFFHLQYYLTVEDNPSAIDSGVESLSDYYDYCYDVPLTAKNIVKDPSDPMIRWKFDYWVIWGYYMWPKGQRSITLHMNHSTAYKTIIAYYKKQYCVKVTRDPSDVPTTAILSPKLGKNWYDYGETCNCTAMDVVAIDSGTRYKFVGWSFDGYWPGDNPHVFGVDKAYEAVAHYKLQFKGTWTADPSKLNAIITAKGTHGIWPNYNWFDAYKNCTYGAPSGALPDLPYDWIFDHWEINGNGEDYPKYASIIEINFTEPINGIAHYNGKDAFFMTEMSYRYKVPSECTKFNVSVTAANLVDLYGMDFEVTWDSTLLELQDVYVYVDKFWKSNFWFNTTSAGSYQLVATGLSPTPSFNGTETVVTLTFHIIYDPCYLWPYYKKTPIDLKINNLANSKGEPMTPWNHHGSYYRIDAIQPILEIRGPDGTNTIVASEDGYEFDVTIWILNAIKLHDWHAKIYWDGTLLEATSVIIHEDFLTGPYETIYYDIDWNNVEFIVVQKTGATPVNGNGTLATITFKVKQSYIWTKGSAPLYSFVYVGWTESFISVKCPDYAEIRVSTGDLKRIRADYYYKAIPGDCNKDGIVNVLDLQLVAGEYGQSSTYDLDNSGKVDLLDLVIVAINYGRDEP